MCCYANKEAKQKIMEHFGKRKTALFWKCLDRQGRSFAGDMQYGPGRNTARGVTTRYNVDRPRGIHVWLDKPRMSYGSTLVQVVCHRDDLIRAGASRPRSSCGFVNRPEAVFRHVRITLAAWQEMFARRRPIARGDAS